MYKLLDKYIEWLVATVVVLITTYTMLRNLFVTLDVSFINGVVKFLNLLLVYFVLIYQKKHYGIKVLHKGFVSFFLLYSVYILLYISLFRVYPLENMTSVPESIVDYFYCIVLSMGYILSAQTIVQNLSVKKYLFLSILVCLIPSLMFIEFVGVEALQAGIGEDDDNYISTLLVTYSNVPIMVISIIFCKKLNRRIFFSILTSLIIIAGVLFVMFAFAKRGPILWAMVSVSLCYVVSSNNIKKLLISFFFFIFLLIIFIDPIIENLKDTLPRTGYRLEATIKEGDTDGRFDLSDPKHSTYLVGLENFSRSPLWGYYFRMVTNFQYFRGGYAHNVFIEILMTMGLLGFIPFVVLLLRAWRNSRCVLSHTHSNSQMCCFILFSCVFLQLQTTGTIVAKYDFWLFFYILCCLDKLSIINKQLTTNAFSISNHYNA